MGHIAQSFWRRFFNFVNVFSLFPNYLLFGKGVALHLNKLESSLPEDALYQVGWNWPSGSGAEDFCKLWIYFYYFPIIPPLGRAWPFIWTNLNQLHLRMLCAKVGLNRCNGSAEKKILKCHQCIFSYFAIISHLKKAWPFIWTNLNPHLPRIFWAKLYEIGPVVLKKKILLNVDLLFSI